MTEGQKFRFYFPAWSACCRANGWRMKEGALLIDPEQLSEEGRQVYAMARQRAMANHRAPNLDDMRHGAHIVALKRDKSSDHLTNQELDRVVCLFHVLEDPLWLGDERKSGMIQWMAYQRGEDPGAAKRIDWFIENAAPEAYTLSIIRDKFGKQSVASLTAWEKNDLARTLSERNRAKRRPQEQKTEVRRPAPGIRPPAAGGKRTYVLNPAKKFETANLPF